MQSCWYFTSGYFGELDVASNPGLPRPDFISQPIFLHGCEIKSGRGRPEFEAKVDMYVHSVSLPPGVTHQPSCLDAHR